MSSTSSNSQDWPLSKEEQKKRIIRLYDKDVKAANELVHSREAALKQAIKELKAARAEAKKIKAQEPEIGHERRSTPRLMKAALENGKLSERRSRWEHHDEPEEPISPLCTDDASETCATAEADDGADGAVEAAERLQTVIVDAAATLASLFGTSSLSSVLVGIAEGAEQDEAGVDGTEKHEGRQRAKSEGCRVIAPEPREELVDRRRRKSRGGTPLRVSWADEVEEPRRRPSIGEPEPSPSNSPREVAARPVAAPALPNPGQRNCITRRPRRGRAPAPSSAPSGMLDFI